MDWNWQGTLGAWCRQLGMNWRETGVLTWEYIESEKNLRQASCEVDKQIEIIKAIVESIIDPALKLDIEEALVSLIQARVKELKAISEINRVLLWSRNDQYIELINVFQRTNIWMGYADNTTKAFITINESLCKILEIDSDAYKWIDYPTFWNKFVVDQEAFEKLKKEYREKWEVNWWILPIVTAKWNKRWIRIYSIKIEWNREILTILDITQRELDRIELNDTKNALEATLAIVNHENKNTIWAAAWMLKEPELFFPSLDKEWIESLKWIWKWLDDRLKAFANYLDIIKMAKWEYNPNYSEIWILSRIKSEIPITFNDWQVTILDENWQEATEEIYFEWDDVYIWLALNNLIYNATQHSTDWTIKIILYEDVDNIYIEIYNDKPISEELTKVLYTRVVKSTRWKAWNWIWTYLIWMVIKNHGWKISFKTSEEHWTTTIISLPIKWTNHQPK